MAWQTKTTTLRSARLYQAAPEMRHELETILGGMLNAGMALAEAAGDNEDLKARAERMLARAEGLKGVLEKATGEAW